MIYNFKIALSFHFLYIFETFPSNNEQKSELTVLWKNLIWDEFLGDLSKLSLKWRDNMEEVSASKVIFKKLNHKM